MSQKIRQDTANAGTHQWLAERFNTARLSKSEVAAASINQVSLIVKYYFRGVTP
jgi:hypothetical protein